MLFAKGARRAQCVDTLCWLNAIFGNYSVTRVNYSTRATIFGDSDSTRVTLRKMVNGLESRFSQNGSTRYESQSMTWDSSQSHFYKIFEPLMNKPSSFAHKEMSIFFLQWCSRLVQIFCFDCLDMLCYILRINCPQLTQRQTWDYFHWGVSRAQYLDNLSWFHALFVYGVRSKQSRSKQITHNRPHERVCYERVCYEHGLLWKWSVLNRSVMNGSVMNVVCYERVCFEWEPLCIVIMAVGIILIPSISSRYQNSD